MSISKSALPIGHTALVHDWLVVQGGAERVLEAVLPLFPDAPIFSLFYSPESFAGHPVSRRKVITSYLDRLPFARKIYRSLLPLMPLAVEQLDLRGYGLVLSLTDAVSHGVILAPDQVHVNYIFTPPRYAWRQYHSYLEDSGLARGLRSWAARLVLHYIRLWDYAAAARVDHFVAISRWVARGVMRAYRREAYVLYPPVDVDRFQPAGRRDEFFLTVSRLVPYKKVHLMVEAFNRMGRPLVIIGDGPEHARLAEMAGKTVTLMGRQPDAVVAEMMGRARAFVHAAEEDFGIAPVEAQAAGCPVIAYGRGGVVETVQDGVTGVLFPDQTSQSLAAAVERFELGARQFEPGALRASAERFGLDRFRREFASVIEKLWADFERDER
jgi:glycosyltransferase involved in cell wall biosynthesis